MNSPRAARVGGLLLLTSLVACRRPAEEPTPAQAPPAATAPASSAVVVVVPARAGAVEGTNQNSDEFLWRQLTRFAAPVDPANASPVVFETWASDDDTFSATPAWPAPDAPRTFGASTLLSTRSTSHAVIDVPCAPPGNAAAGGFPTTGTPTPCIAEEVKRNRPQYDYIVNNGLNTRAGLATAFKNKLQVTMPSDALAVKGDWVPVATLLQWIPSTGSVERIRTLYYTTTSNSVEYALVALHISSRQNNNWVWGTLEHELNPGRCDDLGCFDSFGARTAVVPPNRTAPNTQYGVCEKTPELRKLMEDAKLSPAWQHYCMRSTQVDYVSTDGTPNALGNSVIERIVGNGTVVASSCIGCHTYASFDETGAPSAAATAMLPYNPTGQPIPAVLQGSLKFDFMWGVLNAP